MRTPAPLATLLALLAFASPAAAQPADLGVLDPATPVVRIRVRAPAHLAPGKPLVYRVFVTNASAAAANKVVVRHPLLAGVTKPPEMEPKPETPAVPSANFREWKLETLPAGETKEFKITYELPAGMNSVTAQAFVTYEHGQAVTTLLETPEVQVTKSAPEKALGTGPIPVAVRVTNTGKVAVRDIVLVEDIPAGFEFVPDGDGEATAKPEQRSWRVTQLAPGESKVINYRVRLKDPKKGVDFLTTSNVKGTSLGPVDPASTATRILTPEIQLKVTGPPTGITGEPSKYVAEVKNTGNTPLDSVRLTVDLPAGSRATAGSAGGQRDGDRLLWDVPADRQRNGPLGIGETARVEFSLTAAREGEQVVKVHADGGRGVEKSERVTTAVKGAAGLTYTVDLEPGVLVVGMPGIVTYTVRNNGTAAAKGVTLRVKLPTEVVPKEMTPKYNADRGEAVFEPRTILPGDAVKYTVTYTAKQPGRAEFTFSLTSEADPKPLIASKIVTITEANQ